MFFVLTRYICCRCQREGKSVLFFLLFFSFRTAPSGIYLTKRSLLFFGERKNERNAEVEEIEIERQRQQNKKKKKNNNKKRSGGTKLNKSDYTDPVQNKKCPQKIRRTRKGKKKKKLQHENSTERAREFTDFLTLNILQFYTVSPCASIVFLLSLSLTSNRMVGKRGKVAVLSRLFSFSRIKYLNFQTKQTNFNKKKRSEFPLVGRSDETMRSAFFFSILDLTIGRTDSQPFIRESKDVCNFANGASRGVMEEKQQKKNDQQSRDDVSKSFFLFIIKHTKRKSH